MNFPFFVAKKFGFKEHNGKMHKHSGIKIAVVGISISLAVTLIAFSVAIGFKNEVTDQVVGFGSHIQISAFDSGESFDKSPITIEDSTLKEVSNIKHIENISKIASKPGIIKTSKDFEGAVFKGVDTNYNWGFLERNLVSGRIIDINSPESSNEVLISKDMASALLLDVGDEMFAYFFQTNVRARKFVVSGIYSTSFSDFDNLFVICNINTVRTLNQWDSTQFSYLEITSDNFDKLSETESRVRAILGNRFDSSNLLYNIQTIKHLYPAIFSWLDMLDINVWIILSLMILVAGFNMISAILILIFEKTQTIGVLKALGMKTNEIRKVFYYNAMFFILKGMLWGNLVGFLIILGQYFTHIIRLNPEYYYTSYVPMAFVPLVFLAINVGVFLLSILVMLIPTNIIANISPAKSIKFE